MAEANEDIKKNLLQMKPLSCLDYQINLLFCNCNSYVDMPSVHAHRQDYLKGYKVGKKECTVEVHLKESKSSDELAVARPSPLFPPVITAISPSSRFGINSV
ncbi:MAG: hypothetical protein WA323_01445 [Candidatus Nitrosopolaris sp.]